ncbi:MAG TPA: ABC transporter permease subunit [Stellaceae bacterium]|nr:ABC transporter permease subunit [Stellaceae bacterium]
MGGRVAVRALLAQAALVAAVVAGGAYLVHNTLDHLASEGIATGFDYLGREASFEIGQSLIPYSPSSSYGRALLVGLLNTLLVSALGIVLATVLGTAVGIARLSRNWIVAKLALVYVEALRNVPLLLQLIVWWDLLRVSAPPPRAAWQPLPGVYVSVRGIVLPVPVWHWGALPHWDWPALHGFNFTGGITLTPEFAALLIGLTVYTAAFIAEIVRSGIEGVPAGQAEAAAALGLRRGQVLRLVVLPQALRIIVPPLASEYLALTKNSSLAIAIGYPELMSITNTTLNQTGQAIEAIALMMAIYLAVSLATSLAMNWYNRRVALAGE